MFDYARRRTNVILPFGFDRVAADCGYVVVFLIRVFLKIIFQYFLKSVHHLLQDNFNLAIVGGSSQRH